MRADRSGGRVAECLPVTPWPGAIVAVVVAAGLLSACGSGGAGNGTADQAFVAAVHLGAPDIASFRSNMQLIRLGHAACDGFRSGASYEQLADRMSLLEGRNPLPSQDFGVVVTSAVDAYCPQFRSRV